METKAQTIAFDVKQLMGKNINEIVHSPLWSYDITNYCEQIYLIFNSGSWAIRAISSVEIHGYLLEQIKKEVEQYQGTKLTDAVITVPSCFTQKQNDAIIDAAFFARWRNGSLLLEPVAALIAYSFEARIPNKSTVLLFDCGDGTANVCIAKIYGTFMKVLIDNGNFLLGGKEYDKILINYFGNLLKQKHDLDVFSSCKKYRLMNKCREIKQTLSVEKEGLLYVDDFLCDNDDIISISRNEFEKMAAVLIRQKQCFIEETLEKAKLSSDSIDIVFLAGGSSRMPMIQKLLKKIFPNAEHKCSRHPEELVAKGAALYAYSLATETIYEKKRRFVTVFPSIIEYSPNHNAVVSKRHKRDSTESINPLFTY